MGHMHVVMSTEPGIGIRGLTTPFEDWCELHGLHPEEAGAWEMYRFVTAD